MGARSLASRLGVGAGVTVAVVLVMIIVRPSASPSPSIDGRTAESPDAAPLVTAEDAPADGTLPDGFARSEEGAAAAATSYLAVLQRLVPASSTERDDSLRRIAASDAPSVVADGMRGLAMLDDVVAEARAVLPSARTLVREIPVAYTVGPFHRDRVRVDVWSLGIVVIEGRTEATQLWSTNVVELVWERDNWKVWSWTRSPGPVPATPRAQATSPSGVLDAIDGWEGYRYVPSS